MEDLDRQDEGWRGRKVQGGGGICIRMADSFCCTTETNRTLYGNYTSHTHTQKSMGIFPEELTC